MKLRYTKGGKYWHFNCFKICFCGKWKLLHRFRRNWGERKSPYRISVSDVQITPNCSHQRGDGELAPIVYTVFTYQPLNRLSLTQTQSNSKTNRTRREYLKLQRPREKAMLLFFWSANKIEHLSPPGEDVFDGVLLSCVFFPFLHLLMAEYL